MPFQCPEVQWWTELRGYQSVDRYLRISAIFHGYGEDTDTSFYDHTDMDTDTDIVDGL